MPSLDGKDGVEDDEDVWAETPLRGISLTGVGNALVGDGDGDAYESSLGARGGMIGSGESLLMNHVFGSQSSLSIGASDWILLEL